MEEIDLSSLSEQEVMDIYSNVIEGGQELLIAKSCPSGYHYQSWNGGVCCKDSNSHDCINP